MNYNYLRYFSVLAEVEHYTVAAARLGISQPALSIAIHNLENSLGGVKLFKKVGRNIQLTEEGRFFRERVNDAIQSLSDATVILRDSKILAPVIIRLGFVSGTLDGLLAQEIVKYSRSNDRIRFQLTESSAENLMDLIRQEKLDMAIVDSSNRDRTLHFRKLGQRDVFLALPIYHPLANRESVRPEEVAGEPQVVFNYNNDGAFQEWAAGIASDESVVCTVDTARAALDLVAAGAGIAFVPSVCVEKRPGVRYVQVKNWHQALYMCILYDRWLDPPIWDFVELTVKAFRAKNGGQ